jgi:hypothetical protein
MTAKRLSGYRGFIRKTALQGSRLTTAVGRSYWRIRRDASQLQATSEIPRKWLDRSRKRDVLKEAIQQTGVRFRSKKNLVTDLCYNETAPLTPLSQHLPN